LCILCVLLRSTSGFRRLRSSLSFALCNQASRPFQFLVQAWPPFLPLLLQPPWVTNGVAIPLLLTQLTHLSDGCTRATSILVRIRSQTMHRMSRVSWMEPPPLRQRNSIAMRWNPSLPSVH
jgi:hypothetical protein